MASIGPITVGIRIEDPNWQLLCMALTGHSMRALGYLEADRPDLALDALKDARAAGDLAMMVKAEMPHRPGNHVFNDQGVCECGQRTKDDPQLCTVYS